MESHCAYCVDGWASSRGRQARRDFILVSALFHVPPPIDRVYANCARSRRPMCLGWPCMGEVPGSFLSRQPRDVSTGRLGHGRESAVAFDGSF